MGEKERLDEAKMFAFPNDAYSGQRGMMLRDWFAGQVLMGMLAHDATGLAEQIAEGKGEIAIKNTARLSYLLADAMLKERERK
jgi:hypothetical protein